MINNPKSSITKQTLAKDIFYEVGIPSSIAAKIIDSIFAELIEGMVSNGVAKIHNFGSFAMHAKKPRLGRNLNTGEAVEIKARNVVSFNSSIKLKQVINVKEEE